MVAVIDELSTRIYQVISPYLARGMCIRKSLSFVNSVKNAGSEEDIVGYIEYWFNRGLLSEVFPPDKLIELLESS